MTVIKASDLDAQMGNVIDPNSVAARKVGAERGVMQGNFLPSSETIQTEQGYGRRGAAVFSASELPEAAIYGSSTVVSLNDLPALEPKMEPKPVPVPPMPVQTPSTPSAQQTKAVQQAPTVKIPALPVAQIAPMSAPPQATPPEQPRIRSIAELLASLPKPKAK